MGLAEAASDRALCPLSAPQAVAHSCTRPFAPGGSHGLIIGHVAPEAQVGGPIAFVQVKQPARRAPRQCGRASRRLTVWPTRQDGDIIRIDARSDTRTLDLLVSPATPRAARCPWRQPFRCSAGDAHNPRLCQVSEEEMTRRKAKWTAPPLKYTRGTMYKYIKTVSCPTPTGGARCWRASHAASLLEEWAAPQHLTMAPPRPWTQVSSAAEGCVTDE